ncbi:MAG: hypothetical protein R2716_12945 [Microthrixaceae bacterium]
MPDLAAVMDPIVPRIRTPAHPLAAHAVAECAGSLLEIPAVIAARSSAWSVLLRRCALDITGAAAKLLGARRSVGIEVLGSLLGDRVARGSPSLVVLAFPGDLEVVTRPLDGPCSPADAIPAAPTGGSGTRSWWVVADRGSLRLDPPSAAGRLPQPLALAVPGEAPVVGGFASDSAAGGVRLVLDGDERRVGVVSLGLPVEPGGFRVVTGATPVGPATRVTGLGPGGIRELDGRAAPEYLRAMLAASVHPGLEEATEVGFTAEGDPRLVAVGESDGCLVTSIPVSEGQRLVPSVVGPRAMRRQLGAALRESGAAAPFVLLDRRAPLGDDRGDLPEPLADVRAPAGASVGAISSGLLWGSASSLQELRSGAVVLRLTGPAPSGGPRGDS